MGKTDEEKKAEQRRYAKETYYLRKQLGICVWCGKEKAAIGFTQCPACQEKNAQRTREYYRKIGKKKRNKKESKRKKEQWRERKEKGLCVKCGRVYIPNGKLTCNECLGYRRKSWKKNHPPKPSSNWVLEKRMRGECLWCEKPAVDGYAHCEEHLKKKQEIGRQNILPTYRGLVKSIYGEKAAYKREMKSAAKWQPPKMKNT